MKVAYVHDWLVTYRGGEKVLEALLTLYPDAPLYTLFYDPNAVPASISGRKVITPAALKPLRKLRKAVLPILPTMIERFDFSSYDLVISTSSCVAKGIRTSGKTKHICYLHSPMRYIWDQQTEYIQAVSHIPGAAATIRAFTPRLRRWDIESAQRVDRFVVNSTFVGERCKDYYHRGSHVVHPPIETKRFLPQPKVRANDNDRPYVIAAGALVSYKRFDLAIAACEQLGRRLIIAGAGPMEGQLRKLAGKNTEFIISPDDTLFTNLIARADALLFPGVEDFGMVAVESMAAGTPVIAFAKGGARDFIVPAKTGLFFEESTPSSLAQAIANFDKMTFDTKVLQEYAAGYSQENFLTKMKQEIQLLLRDGRFE